MGGMDEVEQRVRAYLAGADRDQFLLDVRVLYEREKAEPGGNGPRLARRLGVNEDTLRTWLDGKSRKRVEALRAAIQVVADAG